MHAECIAATVELIKSTVPILTIDLASWIMASLDDIMMALQQNPSPNGSELLLSPTQHESLHSFADILGFSNSPNVPPPCMPTPASDLVPPGEPGLDKKIPTISFAPLLITEWGFPATPSASIL
jgi:hypothetical protein